ncbi:hypothetical protein B2J88_44370 [Rhodococcus sp. SRB_17]|nr:hypothetical protein [Rhodococcus sp. SRB_17]
MMLPKDVRPRLEQGAYVRALGSVVTLTTADRMFRTRELVTLFLFASFGELWTGMALPLSEER